MKSHRSTSFGHGYSLSESKDKNISHNSTTSFDHGYHLPVAKDKNPSPDPASYIINS
jgi:hypothetical protein